MCIVAGSRLTMKGAAVLVMLLLALTGVGGVDNRVKRIDLDGNLILYKGIVYVGPRLTAVEVYYNTSSSATSIVPESSVREVERGAEGGGVWPYVYVNRMTALKRIVATIGTGGDSVATVSLRDIAEISIVPDIYGSTFVYYGAPPRELMPHISTPVCSEGYVPIGPGIDAQLYVVSAGNSTPTPIVLSMSVSKNYVSSPGVCGNIDIVVGGIESGPGASVVRSVWVDCSDAVLMSTGDVSVLSGPALGLGVWMTGGGGNDVNSGYRTARVCVVRSNQNEINHVMAGVMLAIMGISLSTWIRLTRGLYNRIGDPEEENRIWQRLSVAVSSETYDVLLMAISLLVTLAAKREHNVYSFEALQLVPQYVVDAAVDAFVYGGCPIIGGGALLCLAIGGVRYGKRAEPEHAGRLFGWDIEWVRNQSLGFRIVVFVVVLVCAEAGIVGVWYSVIRQVGGTVAVGGLMVLTLLHMSNPWWITVRVERNASVLDDLMPILLVWLRWGPECVWIMCIQLYLPVDVAGELSPRFHIGVGIGLGLELLLITGRDFACMLVIGRDRMTTGVLVVGLVVMAVVCGCVVMMVSIFSLGSGFANSEALRNKPDLALCCSVSFSLAIFVGAFLLWCLDDVGVFRKGSAAVARSRSDRSV